jgi:hypothetical protein
MYVASCHQYLKRSLIVKEAKVSSDSSIRVLNKLNEMGYGTNGPC